MQAFRGVTVLGATASLERTLHYLLHTVLALERAPHDVQLRVHVVPLARMRQLNCDYKGVDAPTDVLTFTPASAADSFVNALLFGDNNDEADAHEGEERASVSSACWTNGSRPIATPPHSATSSLSSSPSPSMRAELVELGDIFVSLEYMQRRCAASRSLPFVPYLHAAMVHATLHALGYDHTTSEELQRMVRREQQLGSRIAALSRRVPGYLPPLDVWDVEEVEKPARLF